MKIQVRQVPATNGGPPPLIPADYFMDKILSIPFLISRINLLGVLNGTIILRVYQQFTDNNSLNKEIKEKIIYNISDY